MAAAMSCSRRQRAELFLKPNHKISFGVTGAANYIDSDFKRYMLMIKWPNNGIYDSNAYPTSSHMRRQKRFRIHVAGAVVVIAVSAMLMGALLPAIGDARSFQSISCQSNLQTLSTAFVQYNRSTWTATRTGSSSIDRTQLDDRRAVRTDQLIITWFSSLDKYLSAGQRR
jgi:hypothetical protein